MKTSFVSRLTRRFNPLTGRHLSVSLAPLALALACALAFALLFPRAALASVTVGLAAGIVLGLPLAGLVARSLNARITFARAKADLVAGNPPPIVGDDDLERLTRRLDQIGRRVKDGEDTLAAAHEQARQLADSRTEFLAAMNHELRTPLNSILGFGQVLEMSPSLPPEERESLQQVLRGGRHLLRLVNELLQISDAEGGHADLSPEPVQIAEVLAEAMDLVLPMAAHRGIGMDGSSGMNPAAWVVADRQRLQQVLMNLLTNAVKFNRERGSITIDATRAAGRWRISVRDTGPGLGEDEQRRLFAPFDRLDAGRKGIEGAGLGLALVKGLVERMNGALGVESAPGAGSTFWIELEQAAAPSAPALEIRRVSDSGAAVVLHIEDNPANQHLVQRLLEKQGLRVMQAMQGRLGVALALEHRPSLILLDLNLPDTHGLDLLRALRQDERMKDVPIVVVTADLTPGQRGRALLLGAAAVLHKPLDVPTFLETVSQHLSRVPEPCPPAK